MNISASTALLLLDLQKEMMDPDGWIGRHGLAAIAAERDVVARAAGVLDAFRAARAPVAHVRLGFQPGHADALSRAPRIAALVAGGAAVVGSRGCEFVEPLTPREGELVVTKNCVNPFFNTGLLAWLARRQVTQVVLAGVATHLVVESAARAADDAGLGVTVLEDCCAAPDPELHQFTVTRILPAFGTVCTSGAFLAAPVGVQ